MKWLTISSLLGLSIALQSALLAFYSSGPEAIISVPITIIMYVVISIVAGIIINKVKARRYRAGVYLLSLLVICLSVSAAHPTDGEIKPHTYLARFIQAQLSRGSITYKNIYDEGKLREPYKSIAISKYREQLPERAFVVHYYLSENHPWDNRIRLVFEKHDNGWRFLNLSEHPISADIEETLQVLDKRKFEVFRVIVNDRVFTERYHPRNNSKNSYFQSLDGPWGDEEPRIVIYEWSA